MLRASVVVPTRNRCLQLGRCIASLVEQDLPPDEFEIVIVDNGSTDGTLEVAERWRDGARNVRVEVEPAIGVSRARNAGFRATEGEVVAFLDDDAVATRSWLAALLDGYARWPQVGGVVGPVRLVWQSELPRWVAPGIERWFSGLDLGTQPRLLSESDLFFGANMSVRRRWLEHGGGFAVELGRTATGLISNEEKDLFLRLREWGQEVGYEPGASVWHSVASDRVSVHWLVRRAFDQGRSDVGMERLMSERGTQSPHIAARVVRGLGGAGLGWLAMVATIWGMDQRAGVLVAQIARQASALGYAREALSPSLTPRSRARRPR